MKLYDIAENYLSVREALFNADDNADEAEVKTLEQRFDEVTDALEAKVETIALIDREMRATEAALKEEENRIHKRRKALTNRRKRLEAWLMSTMQHAEVERVDGLRATVAIQYSPPAVVFEGGAEAALPPEFVVEVPATTRPDKKAITDAIAQGRELPGVSLVRRAGLRIR